MRGGGGCGFGIGGGCEGVEAFDGFGGGSWVLLVGLVLVLDSVVVSEVVGVVVVGSLLLVWN